MDVLDKPAMSLPR